MPELVSWFARTPERYTSKGCEAIRTESGWFLRWGERKARGPFRDLDAAMEAWAAIKKDSGT